MDRIGCCIIEISDLREEARAPGDEELGANISAFDGDFRSKPDVKAGPAPVRMTTFTWSSRDMRNFENT